MVRYGIYCGNLSYSESHSACRTFCFSRHLHCSSVSLQVPCVDAVGIGAELGVDVSDEAVLREMHMIGRVMRFDATRGEGKVSRIRMASNRKGDVRLQGVRGLGVMKGKTT